MESKKLIKAILEPKKKFFVHIGFIFSLFVLLLLLELMSLFSASNHYTVTSVDLQTPLEMGMVKGIKQIQLPQPPLTQPTVITEPKISLLDEIAKKVMEQTAKIDDTLPKTKTDTLEKQFPVHDSISRTEADVEDPMPLTIIEEQPIFPGGATALIKYLKDNVKYPPLAKESGVSGTVIISFIIEKDGSISNVKVFQGIGGGCNDEALRVINLMPKWIPGTLHGKPVRVQIHMPLNFFLSPT